VKSGGKPRAVVDAALSAISEQIKRFSTTVCTFATCSPLEFDHRRPAQMQPVALFPVVLDHLQSLSGDRRNLGK
jgi:hypothetical protein